MKRLFCIVLCVLALCCCQQRPRLIPADRLADMYSDMLMQDQWIASSSQYKKAADTTLVYDHIFKDYGYSFKDYNYSMEYYVRNPKKLEKVLKRVNRRLDNYAKRLEKVDKAWKELPRPEEWTPVNFDTLGAKVPMDSLIINKYSE